MILGIIHGEVLSSQRGHIPNSRDPWRHHHSLNGFGNQVIWANTIFLLGFCLKIDLAPETS